MKIEPGDFIDIGNGWFFALDEDWTTAGGTCHLGVIADSRSIMPNVHYGPAAWKRKGGPVSSLTLIEIEGHPLADGEYASYPFPGTLTVKSTGLLAGLYGLNGLSFDSLESLLENPLFKGPHGKVAIGTAETRLKSVIELDRGGMNRPG
jgi:hypothetical protein